MRKRQKGFTLIELLIVIAVLGALTAVVIPAVAAFLGTANRATAQTESANVRTSAMAYLADNGVYPNDSGDLMGGSDDYINTEPDAVYIFGDIDGTPNNNTPGDYPNEVNGVNPTNMGTIADAIGDGSSAGFVWNSLEQEWEKP
jgi:prepilin-type N-terminal cleavage/methylation domain-containing protein